MVFVRDLKPGDVVPVGHKPATVKSIATADGRNGDDPHYITGQGLKTALAIKIEFEDHEPVYAHPAREIKAPL